MSGYGDALVIGDRKGNEGKDVFRTKKRRFIMSDSESDECPERGKREFVCGSNGHMGLKTRSVVVGGVVDRTSREFDGGGNRDVGTGLIRKAYDAREDFRRVIGVGEEVSVKRMKKGVLKFNVGKVEGGDGCRALENSTCLRDGRVSKKSMMHAAALKICGKTTERRRLVEQPTSRIDIECSSGVIIREKEACGASSKGSVIRVQGRGGLLKMLPGSKKVGSDDSKKVDFKRKTEGGRIRMEQMGGLGKSDPGLKGSNNNKEAVSSASNVALDKQISFIGGKNGKITVNDLSGSGAYKRNSLSEKNDKKYSTSSSANVVDKYKYFYSESRHHDRSVPSYKVDKSFASHKLPNITDDMKVTFSEKESYSKAKVNAMIIDRHEGHVAGEVMHPDESGPSYEKRNGHKYLKKHACNNADKEDSVSVEKTAGKNPMTFCIDAIVENEGSFSGEIKVHDRSGHTHKAKDHRYQDKLPSDMVIKDDLTSGEKKDLKIDLAGFAYAIKDVFSSGDRKPQNECKSYTRRKKRITPVTADEKVVAIAAGKKEQPEESIDHFVKKAEDTSTSKARKSVGKNFGSQKTDRCTEKQKLREQLKNMLLEAGWKIDLRPRRGRDYKDSVYVSPQGTGYWSITKAYAVYMEQLRESEEADISNIDTSGRISNMLTRKSEKARLAAIPLENISILKRIVVNRGKSKENTGENDISVESWSLSRRKVMETPTSEGLTLLSKRRKNKRRCPLLVRSSVHDLDYGADEYIPYTGKRTVLSWMIDSGVLPVKGKIKYMNTNRTQIMLEGWITRDGIYCSCCCKILPVPKFEIHAGSKLGQPYQNIFVEDSGFSLLQCQLSAWEKQEESQKCGFYFVQSNGEDPNDDTCGLCGDGGDLICCDSCPSTFHLSCLEYETLPPGEWHCSSCSCKFCGVVDHGNTHGSSPSSELLQCKQCQGKYHQGCLHKEKATFDEPNCFNSSYCGSSCKKIFEQLQKLRGVKNQLEAGFSWSVVQRIGVDSRESLGTTRRAECNSKVAVAVEVMDECFLPLIDHRSGVNLIHNIVYSTGSNFNRLDFSGFYTFILERGDEMVAAASVRIHGTRIAEMPFIGTRIKYRRQGMCRRLLNAIEIALISLNIQTLAIPAISELIQTWTMVFDFKPIGGSLRKDIKSINLLVFPGTGLLVKTLFKQEDGPLFEGNRMVEIEGKRYSAPVMANGSHAYPVTDDGRATETAMQPGPSTHASSGSAGNAPEMLQSKSEPFFVDNSAIKNKDAVDSSTQY